MDSRDAMSEFGTYLSSLPGFELDLEKMEATFVESGEDRDIDSPPERELSKLELLGESLDNLIAAKVDLLADLLKNRVENPHHGFSKHLLPHPVSSSGITLKDTLLDTIRSRTTAHFAKAYFRITHFGSDRKNYMPEGPARIGVRRLKLELSVGLQHWLIPEGGGDKDRYWPKRFDVSLMVNDTEIGGHGWHFTSPFQFKVTGLNSVHTLAEVGRGVNRKLYGESSPQDRFSELREWVATRKGVGLEGHNVCGWVVTDEVIAEARRELGDWVLHFLRRDDKEYMIHMQWEVCGTCGGKGKHVNPSIDAHGLSSDDLDDDPDFSDDYFGGAYDVSCYECGGRTTSPVIDEKLTSEETLRFVNKWFSDEAAHRSEVAAERRMGC